MTRAWIYSLMVVMSVIGCDSLRKPKVDNPVLGPAPPRVSMQEQTLPDYAYIDTDESASDVVQTAAIENSGGLKSIPNGNVIATVNGAPVFASDIFERYGNRMEEARAKVPPGEFAKLQRTLIERDLKQHIERRLLSEALRNTLTSDQIEAVNGQLNALFQEEIERLKQEFGVATRVELENDLRSRGTSLAGVKDAFDTQQMATQYVAMNVERPGAITRQEMLDYYREHQSDYEFPAQIRWQQIQVTTRGRSAQEAQQRIQSALAELDAGKDFATVARTYSDGPTAKEGGMWDWMDVGSLADTRVEETLQSLRPGRSSGILNGERDFQIVKLVDRKPAGRRPFEEVHDEIKIALQKTRQIDPRSIIDELLASAIIETEYSYK